VREKKRGTRDLVSGEICYYVCRSFVSAVPRPGVHVLSQSRHALEFH
jgi:hypothetical protein